LVADVFWTVNGEEVTEVNTGQEVVANVVFTTYDSLKVNGEVTVEVWKDIRLWPDQKHNDYEKTVPINLDAGQQSSVIQLPFLAEHASNPIPGLGFKGYYLKVHFTGSGISNVGSNRIEDVWVTWTDGGGNSMKNEYPPRLKVNMQTGILNIKVESPVNLLVVDPQGNRVGFDYISGEIVNEIPGALYNGLGTEPQLISISEPLNGDYTILLSGTGAGNYSLTVGFITPEKNVTQTYNGEILENDILESVATISENEMTTTPPLRPQPEAFPWWILGAVIVVMLGVGATLAFWKRRKPKITTT
jgi:hypothetical protein